jgi:putative transposase
MLKPGHRVGASTIRQILKAPGAPCGAETAHRYDVAAVPAYPSRDDARHRLLSRGLRGVPSAPVLLLRDRGRPRYVHILGITTNPDRPWTTQQIRNLLVDPGGRAAGFRFLVRDRPGSSPHPSDAVLASAGIEEAVKIPPRSPRANAFAERLCSPPGPRSSTRC